ncbi:MAG TPA: PAS domain-containing protein, partial [Steroidobacteraceae bacterium]|nr:PAS domain-containing protein [Steroidobacteraceae bacterium]
MSQSFSGGDRRDRQAALLDGWLSSLMPGARILIVRPAADRRTATVVSDHGSPCTEGAKLHFPPGALARALASGAHIVRCAADVPAGRSHPAPFRYRERAELLIVPRPTEARGRQIAAVVLPRERHRALQSERLLRTAMRQWKSHFASMARELAKWTPIMRAKQEWESTVDALPEVICLIDSEQRVLRANRAVERWGLGSVKSVLGTPLHSLFHPACDGVDCALLNSLTELCSAHWKVGSAALEFEARVGEKTVLLQVRPMPPAGALDLPPVIHAIFVATDVTALRSAQQELRALNDELEYRIADRTHELMEANGDLREQVGRRIEAEQALVTSRN